MELDPDDFIEEDIRRARASAALSIEDNPDDAAAAQALAQATGVPPALVLNDLPAFENQIKAQTTAQLLENPDLQQYVNSDPLAAKISNDDWATLDTASELVRKLPRPWGFPGGGRSPAELGEIAGSAFAGFQEGFRIEEQIKGHQDLYKLMSTNIGPLNAALITASLPVQTVFGGVAALHGISGVVNALAAGASTALFPGEPAQAARLARDLIVLANVAMPELVPGGQVLSYIRGFERVVKPYVDEGKTPPPGLHPVIDELHKVQAEQDLLALQEALKTSLESTTRERSPDTYAGFIRQITDGEITVSADVVRELYGDKVPVPDDGILGWVPKLAEQLATSEVVGQEISIPIADFLAKVEPQVAKALEEHIRVRPEGVTVEEAKAPPAEPRLPEPGFEVWHGSPHVFEKFDEGKIGTGEGAQSYGYGLYLAENEKVAQDYSKRLAAKKGHYDVDQEKYVIPEDGNMYRVRVRRAPEEFLDYDADLSSTPVGQAAIAGIDPVFRQQLDEMLDSHGQAALEDLTGGQLLQLLERWASEDQIPGVATDHANPFPRKEASEYLRSLGIPGIRYLDQGSRSKVDFVEQARMEVQRLTEAVKLDPSEHNVTALADAKASLETAELRGETRNYVIFSPADLEILDRNGEAIKATREAAGLRRLADLPPAAPDTTKAKQLPLALPDTLPMNERAAYAKAEALGMDVARYKLYQKAIERQHEADVAAATKRLAAEERRRQSQDWKEKAAALRPEVVDQVRARPEVAADILMREGRVGDVNMGPLKIGTEYLTPEQQAALPRSYFAKGRESPSLLAELTGFPDGNAFIQSLTDFHAQRKASGLRPDDYQRRLITEELNREMEARYGKLDENVMEAVKEQVLSETELFLLHEETVALATKAGLEYSLTRAGTQQMINDNFAKFTVKHVNSDRYLANAGKAGKAAEIALLKGDSVEAFTQKQVQYHAVEAARLAKELEIGRTALNKIAARYAARDVKGVDQDTRYFIQQLLAEADFKTKMLPEEITREIAASSYKSLEDLVTTETNYGYEPVVAEPLFNRGPRPLEAMTVEEFRQFKDAIETLNFIARDKDKIEVRGERMDREKFRDEVLARLEQRPARDVDAVRKGGNIPFAIDASWTRMEEIAKALDNREKGGPLWRALIMPFDLSKAKEYQLKADLVKRIETSGFDKKWYDSLHDDVPNNFVPDTRNGTLMKMTRWNVMRMALNMGNESNFNKLITGIARAQIEGAKPAPEHLDMVRGQIEDLVGQVMKAEDWRYVQHMWDLFESFRPDIEVLDRNTTGIPTKWIKPREVVTPHGTFRGGYLPLIEDKTQRFNFDGRERPSGGAGPLDNDFFRATTSRGHLEERTGAQYFVDLSTGPEQLMGRLQQVIHDLAYRDFIINAGKVVYDKKIRAMIDKHYGPEYTAQLEPWLKDVANAMNADEPALNGMQRVLRWARQSLVFAALPLNYTVMLSPSLGTANLKQAYKFNANRRFNEAMVMANSKEIPHLLYSLDRDLTNALDVASGKGKWTSFQKRAASAMFSPLVKFEQEARMVTFFGEFVDLKTKGYSDFEAAALADSLVRERHTVAAIGDLPALMRNPNEFIKIATVFMGYFTAQRNWARQLPDAIRQKQFSEAGKILWGTVAIPALYNLTLFTKPKQDEGFFKYMARVFGSIPMQMVPFGREVWSFFSEGFRSNSPLVSLGIAVGNMIKDGKAVAEGKTPKQPIKHILTAVGVGSGFPGSLQIARTAEFAYDVSTGQQKPRDMIEWMRGIATGEAKLRK